MTAARDNVVELPRRRALPDYGDAHVPAGEYQVALAGCETWQRCHGWAPRVVLVFVLTNDYIGTAIPGYYRVKRLHGRQRRNGRFEIGTRSRLYRDLGRMLGRRPPQDRVPVVELDGVFEIVLRDVTRDRDDHPLGPSTYSVVDWIRGPA